MAEFTVTQTVNCPYCESEKVVKNGSRSGYQRYRCGDCRKQFSSEGNLHGRHVPPEQMGAAIRRYYSGMSYKQIGESMAEMFDIPEPSKSVICYWVRDYTQAALREMENHPAHTSGHWVVDEMVLDVGGDKMWNWNVMDSKTRYLLASYLSTERDQKSAEAVLRKAAAASAEPPTRITTDKLPSYVPAIRKVFPDAHHIQSEGLDSELNNNRSERMQGTFRDRTKTMRGLQGRASGQRYLDGWVLQYNLFREHEGLGYRTPGEAANVNPPFSEWSDVAEGAATQPPETERQEVQRQTTVRRWVRENWQTVDGYRRNDPDLVWQKIPIADVMANSEKMKVRQSRPAPGFHQGSRYYIARMPDGGLAYVRVSNRWGDLPAMPPRGKSEGLPERQWILLGGRRARSGESQPSRIHPDRPGWEVGPVTQAGLPKAVGNAGSSGSPQVTEKAKRNQAPVGVERRRDVATVVPEITIRKGDLGRTSPVHRPAPARPRRDRTPTCPTEVNIRILRG